ncbi:MAG: hypothetical protein GX788_05485, partial [Lactobacillales bacterium]|nr:hypothetical protein [Lactobacillales bacterium]
DNVNQPYYQWRLARAYNELEEFEKANDYYKKAYHYFVDNLDFLENYSEFLQEEGNLDMLKEVVEQALLIDSNNQYFMDIMINRLS